MKLLKGLFTFGSCPLKSSENMFLLGRNWANATKNRQKPGVVSQGKHSILECFSMEWCGTKTKVITTTNQKPNNVPKARENAGGQVIIRFSFASDWLRDWY